MHVFFGYKIYMFVINFCRIRARIKERERISDREKREISENYFLLISNDIFHKELRPIYSNQYGYYL